MIRQLSRKIAVVDGTVLLLNQAKRLCTKTIPVMYLIGNLKCAGQCSTFKYNSYRFTIQTEHSRYTLLEIRKRGQTIVFISV